MTLQESINVVRAHLLAKASTYSDIVKGTGQTGSAVHLSVKALRSAGEIHIAEYRRSGYRMLKVYVAGAGHDVPRPPEEKLAIAERAEVALLKLQGADLTCTQLLTQLAWRRTTTNVVLKFLREKNRIHVCRVERNSHGHAIYVYRAGPGLDSKRPRRRAAAPKPAIKIPAHDPLMAALFGLAA